MMGRLTNNEWERMYKEWSDLRYYYGMYLEGMSKTTKSLRTGGL
jgi:hypothetical protein